jgi:hypothetical protein
MAHTTGPLDVLSDASGSVSFGWLDEGCYFARFSRCLSARVGEAFATRLRADVQAVRRLSYFGDARELESYDLLARSAFVRAVVEQRRKFEGITLLNWDGVAVSPAFLGALGEPVVVLQDVIEFEARLNRAAPAARSTLTHRPDARFRSRWSARR